MNKYLIQISWSEEDDGFIAIAPNLPGCNVWGSTQDDALHEIQTAIDLWIQACKKSGESIPEPSSVLHAA